MTERSLELTAATRRLLLRRGLRLEYTTLARNVVGSVLVLQLKGTDKPRTNRRRFA
ncbi:MAG: hypothetical protein M3P15_05080 [Actinomycetota bacterium]|nr:hypothetical protein [Actinomycetota bacterium]